MIEDAPFPPRCAGDIEAYDQNELLAGFIEFRVDDPFPGDNRSPAYRWGWQNGYRDRVGDDGYDHLRRAVAPKVVDRLAKLKPVDFPWPS